MAAIDLRPEVLRFAEAMEAKLRKHELFGRCAPTNLFWRLEGEVYELRKELYEPKRWLSEEAARKNIADCAAAVANYAMMIFTQADDATLETTDGR